MSRLARRSLHALASLKLTVALIALSLALVFVGTLAQVGHSLLWVQQNYFHRLIAWVAVPGPDSFKLPMPGGYLLGGLLLVNLLASQVTRFEPRWRRVGTLLMHAGIVLLLAGELISGLCRVEGRMAIAKNESANYVEDAHRMELVVIDPSPADHDRIVGVPQSMLAGGGMIRDAQLPFDVHVERWLANSELVDGTAREVPLETGVSGRIDIPSADLTLERDGVPLGRWIVSADPRVAPQPVEVDGRTYDIALRPRRDYKPYTIHLLEFTHEKHPGTDRPKRFESRIRLVDPAAGVDREARISMNQPLRYAGETIYQSSFQGEDVTVLLVVNNPGWLVPYLACVVIAIGMLLHFARSLVGFARRPAS